MDPLDPRRAALLTDLYEVTMAAAYWEHGLNPRATFELFFRRLPPGRGYIVAAGLEQAIDYLLALRFEPEQIGWLNRLFVFHNVRPEFWEFLRDLRFTGDVWAPPEGTPVFPNEPLLRVTAPLIEAQLVETYLISILAYPSLVATQAARLVDAARGRPVVDFGGRRAQVPDAAPVAARAAYIAGIDATSNLEAGERLGIPISGTMAHSFVMAFPDEEEAFRAYHAVFPDSTVALLDTYDTMAAARRIAEMGLPVKAVRLDSGDLATLASGVRQVLDDAGLRSVKIFASGDLDERSLLELGEKGAPIDSYGVGTSLVGLPEMPSLGLVYKIVDIEGEHGGPRLKLSTSKSTLPGTKQVYRRFGTDGLMKGDTLALASETLLGAPLLSPALLAGKRVDGRPGLESIRLYARRAIASVPPETRRLDEPASYPVAVSPELETLRLRLSEAASGAKAG
jgi:nicotinate phosphoribosyltransferase